MKKTELLSITGEKQKLLKKLKNTEEKE
jgi:hypothetical protein